MNRETFYRLALKRQRERELETQFRRELQSFARRVGAPLSHRGPKGVLSQKARGEHAKTLRAGHLALSKSAAEWNAMLQERVRAYTLSRDCREGAYAILRDPILRAIVRAFPDMMREAILSPAILEPLHKAIMQHAKRVLGERVALGAFWLAVAHDAEERLEGKGAHNADNGARGAAKGPERWRENPAPSFPKILPKPIAGPIPTEERKRRPRTMQDFQLELEKIVQGT